MAIIKKAQVTTDIAIETNNIIYTKGTIIWVKKERDVWYPGQEPTKHYFSFWTPDGYYLNYTNTNIEDNIKYIT